MGVVFALFTLGYMLGVWTACLVFKQPQRKYEEAVPAALPSRPVIVLRDASRLGMGRP